MSQECCTEPLHVPRTALIEAVTARFEEEKAKRAKAQKDASDSRKAAVAAVAAFSDDQLTNIVSEYLRHIGAPATTDEIVKWANEKQEAKAFVTKDLQVTSTESSLEKWVRVLSLANDDTIEVRPSDDVYLLL